MLHFSRENPASRFFRKKESEASARVSERYLYILISNGQNQLFSADIVKNPYVELKIV